MRSTLPIFLCATTVAATACAPGKNVASKMLAEPSHEALLGDRTCKEGDPYPSPMIVEWPAEDRASLEGRVANTMVAVRYENCELELLRRCDVPGDYDYTPVTRKVSAVSIDNADQLYAKLPVGAAKLEAKLGSSSSLKIEMNIVGLFQSKRGDVYRSELGDKCTTATHFIDAFQVGAYEFYSAADAEVGAKAEMAGVGKAGASSEAAKEMLSRDGDSEKCQAPLDDRTRPPDGCGALLRLELIPLEDGGEGAPAGSAADGGADAGQDEGGEPARECMPFTHAVANRGCVPDPLPSPQIYPEVTEPLGRAKAAIATGDRGTAEAELGAALAAGKGLAPDAESMVFVAEALFLDAELAFEDALTFDMSAQGDPLMGDFDGLQRVLETADVKYEAVVATMVPEWGLGAMYRKAYLFEVLAAKMETSPIVGRLDELAAADPAAADEARKGFAELVEGMIGEGIGEYRNLIGDAEKAGLSSGWVDKAKRRIEYLSMPGPSAK